jgi:hypothetical protein
MISYGLILVAIGYFLELFETKEAFWIICSASGWALVLYFSVRTVLATHGVFLP